MSLIKCPECGKEISDKRDGDRQSVEDVKKRIIEKNPPCPMGVEDKNIIC